LVGYLVGELFGGYVGEVCWVGVVGSVDFTVGWCVGRLADEFVNWLVCCYVGDGFLVGWLLCQRLICRVVGRLLGWLTG